MSAGETLHVIGREGVRRAKVWLEKTGRVNVTLSRYEVREAPFLTFVRPDGVQYSFDVGGNLLLDGGNAIFYGEVKKVSGEAGQGAQYREYLAKCYCAFVKNHQPYHFMWITWHPFSLTTWTKLCDVAHLKKAVESHREVYCGTDPVDDATCADLAQRLWLIVLSDRQEALSMSDDMLGEVRRAIVKGVAP